jgi:glycosyltransferase involved in cell wall biosynthesis
MKQRMVIVTEIIAPYRIPVFNALAQRHDVEPHVIFLSETDASLREWTVRKKEIEFSYEILPSFRRRVGKFNLLLNRGITQALQAASPDVLLCGGYSYVASWQAAGWARRNHIPRLLWVESTARDLRGGYAPVERLKRRFIESSDGFVVPGRSSAEYLKSFGVADHTIFYAPNAVDNGFFATTAAAHVSGVRREDLPPKFFLYVGRLVREKGVFDLLTAYSRIPRAIRDEFGLVFAGNGPCRPELEQLAARVDGGTIFFTGFLEREELASLYAQAYLLVFPTHSDPWGLVVNEALACGLPVIATGVAGCTADLIEDGWNGCVVSSRDLSQLAAAMESLARDASLRDAMSMRCRERILNYSPEACAEGLARAATAMETVRG